MRQAGLGVVDGRKQDQCITTPINLYLTLLGWSRVQSMMQDNSTFESFGAFHLGSEY